METGKLTNDRIFPTHKLPAQLKQPFVLNIMIVNNHKLNWTRVFEWDIGHKRSFRYFELNNCILMKTSCDKVEGKEKKGFTLDTELELSCVSDTCVFRNAVNTRMSIIMSKYLPRVRTHVFWVAGRWCLTFQDFPGWSFASLCFPMLPRLLESNWDTKLLICHIYAYFLVIRTKQPQ